MDQGERQKKQEKRTEERMYVPTFFNIYMNPLIQSLKDEIVDSLAYAGDIVYNEADSKLYVVQIKITKA